MVLEARRPGAVFARGPLSRLRHGLRPLRLAANSTTSATPTRHGPPTGTAGMVHAWVKQIVTF